MLELILKPVMGWVKNQVLLPPKNITNTAVLNVHVTHV